MKNQVELLNNQERIKIIVQICSAMESVHKLGIIHRNLKLDSILIDDFGNSKICDFGFSTQIEMDEGTINRTQISSDQDLIVPELMLGRTDYNEKIDVFAFGVIVYMILRGRKSPKISIKQIGLGIKPPIPDSISKLSHDLIEMCLSFNASDRPEFNEISKMIQGNENNLKK